MKQKDNAKGLTMLGNKSEPSKKLEAFPNRDTGSILPGFTPFE